MWPRSTTHSVSWAHGSTHAIQHGQLTRLDNCSESISPSSHLVSHGTWIRQNWKEENKSEDSNSRLVRMRHTEHDTGIETQLLLSFSDLKDWICDWMGTRLCQSSFCILISSWLCLNFDYAILARMEMGLSFASFSFFSAALPTMLYLWQSCLNNLSRDLVP